MPAKPKRYMSAALYSKSGAVRIEYEFLPADKQELEMTLTKRFLQRIQERNNLAYEYVGVQDEPGDAILRDPSGVHITFQIAEAVDIVRTRLGVNRAEYGRELWATNPDVGFEYRGVQVALIDSGWMRDVPSVKSIRAKGIIREVANKMRGLVRQVMNLPVNSPDQTKEVESLVRIDGNVIQLRLRRYAQAANADQLQWLWVGPQIVKQQDTIDGFTAPIQKKITKYGRISTPFWLLVYSLELECFAEEQRALNLLLTTTEHPFDCVYVYVTRVGQLAEQLLQVYPECTPSIEAERGTGKRLLSLNPGDAIPRWNDARWQSTPVVG